jgi:hypothetical protein
MPTAGEKPVDYPPLPGCSSILGTSDSLHIRDRKQPHSLNRSCRSSLESTSDPFNHDYAAGL